MNPLLPYKIIAGVLLMAALSWGVHLFLEHERDIGRAEVHALWDAQITKDKEAARVETDRLATQSAQAAKNGAEREQTIVKLAAAANTSAVGLRDAVATIRSGLPSASADALRDTARAFGDVFAECEIRRRSVAEEAERLNSEKRTLIEAWATTPVAPQ